MVCGPSIPRQRLVVISANARPVVKHRAEFILRWRESLMGGLSKPPRRLFVVFGNPQAAEVGHAEVKLGFGIPLHGAFMGNLTSPKIVVILAGNATEPAGAFNRVQGGWKGAEVSHSVIMQ